MNPSLDNFWGRSIWVRVDPTLSLILPLHNKTEALPDTLAEVVPFLEGHFDRFEILLVDDGSRDGTSEVAGRISQNYPPDFFTLIHNERNRGKGYSVAQGVQRARGRWIFFMDSDLSTPLAFLPPFVRQLERGADLVIASRFERGSRITKSRSSLRSFLSWSERGLIRGIAGLRFSDTQCGFKGFRADAARRLFGLSRIDRFCFDVEILFLAQELGFRIETVPVEWGHDPDSSVRVRDPFLFVWDLLRIRWYARQGYYNSLRR